MTDCGAISAQGHKEAGPTTARPIALKMWELLKLIVMETPSRLADCSKRANGKGRHRKRLQRFSAFLADLMDGMLDLAFDFKLEGIVENAAVFEKNEETPNQFSFGWAGIGPLHAAKRRTDTRYLPGRMRCNFAASAKPVSHVIPQCALSQTKFRNQCRAGRQQHFEMALRPHLDPECTV